MPSLIDIRRRVRAVKSTQQITKAMKMVSSSKLRRAQERIVKSRPYAKEMLRVFNNLATRTENATHPLLNDDPLAARTLLIVITADRGLCGSFNTNVAKAALQFTIEQPKAPEGRDVAMALVGRKGRDFFMRRGFDVLYEEVGLFQNVKWSHAQAIAQTAIKEFLGPDISSVYLVYNEFRSVISQRVVIEKLLPIPRLNEAEAANRPPAGEARDASASPRWITCSSPIRSSCSTRCCRCTWRCRCARAARVIGGRTRGAHAVDGQRDAQREGNGGAPDALHEQGPSGGDHARNYRSGFGRSRAYDRDKYGDSNSRDESRQGHPGHRTRHRRRVRGRTPARHLQRRSASWRRCPPARRSTSSPRSSSTSAKAACARSR